MAEFGARWSQVQGGIRALLWSVLLDNDDADDALMDTSLALLRNAHRFEERGDDSRERCFERWAKVAATRKALNVIRARDRRRIDSLSAPRYGNEDEADQDIPYTDEGFGDAETRIARTGDLAEIIALAETINPLGIDLALRFHAFEGYESISATTGLPIGTVKSRVRRAILTMKLAAQVVASDMESLL